MNHSLSSTPPPHHQQQVSPSSYDQYDPTADDTDDMEEDTSPTALVDSDSRDFGGVIRSRLRCVDSRVTSDLHSGQQTISGVGGIGGSDLFRRRFDALSSVSLSSSAAASATSVLDLHKDSNGCGGKSDSTTKSDAINDDREQQPGGSGSGGVLSSAVREHHHQSSRWPLVTGHSSPPLRSHVQLNGGHSSPVTHLNQSSQQLSNHHSHPHHLPIHSLSHSELSADPQHSMDFSLSEVKPAESSATASSSSVGSSQSNISALQLRLGRLAPPPPAGSDDEPVLDRFRPLVERFPSSATTGLNRGQSVEASGSAPPSSSMVAAAAAAAAAALIGRVGAPVSVGQGQGQARSQSPGQSAKGHVHGRPVRSYHCRMCEQEFANKSDMQRHAKEAHRAEDKGHRCSQCPKSFPSSQQLGQHSLVHSNVRKYACVYCDKAFKQLSHVQQHQRIHTGERPYRCRVEGCSKAFRQLSSLQQHLKGHNIPMPKSYPVSHAPPPPSLQPPPSNRSSPSGGSSPGATEIAITARQLNSSLARPHDLTCQVCEKHCANEVRFFYHIHEDHPDYWRVFSGGRPLSDFIENTSTTSSPSSAADMELSHNDANSGIGRNLHHHHQQQQQSHNMQQQQQQHRSHPSEHQQQQQQQQQRVKRYSCRNCCKRFSNESSFAKHLSACRARYGEGRERACKVEDGTDASNRLAATGSTTVSSDSWQTTSVVDMAGIPSKVSLYNCAVCAKLFTKEAYLLRHMEMKLDPAHAAGLEELKKSSGMFRAAAAASAAVVAAAASAAVAAAASVLRPSPYPVNNVGSGGSNAHGMSSPSSHFRSHVGPESITSAKIGGSYLHGRSVSATTADDFDPDDRAMSPRSVLGMRSLSKDDDDDEHTAALPLSAGSSSRYPFVDIAMAAEVARRRQQLQSTRSISCMSPLSSASTSGPSSPSSFTPYDGSGNGGTIDHGGRHSTTTSSYSQHQHHLTGSSSSSGPHQHYQTTAPRYPLPGHHSPTPAGEFFRRTGMTAYDRDGNSGIPPYQPSHSVSALHLYSSASSRSPLPLAIDEDRKPIGREGGSSPELDDAEPVVDGGGGRGGTASRYVIEGISGSNENARHNHHHRLSSHLSYYSPSSPYVRYHQPSVVPSSSSSSSRVGMVSPPGLIIGGPTSSSPPSTSSMTFGYSQYYGGNGGGGDGSGSGARHNDVPPPAVYLRRTGSSGLLEREIVHGYR